MTSPARRRVARARRPDGREEHYDLGAPPAPAMDDDDGVDLRIAYVDDPDRMSRLARALAEMIADYEAGRTE